MHRWQVSEIEEGLRQAGAGEFASETEVEAAYAAFRRKFSALAALWRTLSKSAPTSRMSNLMRPKPWVRASA